MAFGAFVLVKKKKVQDQRQSLNLSLLVEFVFILKHLLVFLIFLVLSQ